MMLYELTREAQAKVAAERQPAIKAWADVIDPVLAAAGENAIGSDTVERITLTDDELVIETSYVSQGCRDEEVITLPLWVLTSDKPTEAANRYRLAEALLSVRAAVLQKQQEFNDLQQELEQLQSELASLDG